MTMSRRFSFRRTGAALSVLITSVLAASPVAAHAALVRGLATAAERTAVLIPGFGAAFASAAGGSFRYACDAQLGRTPFADGQQIVSLGEQGWLLSDTEGLHRISPSGCDAPSAEGFPSERAVAALAVSPGVAPAVYLIDDEAWLYRSDDAGATWTVIAELPSALPVTGLAIAGEAPPRLYVSQSGEGEARLTWSLDAGATFETSPLPADSGLVSLRAVESGEVDRLWLSASRELPRDVAIWRMHAGSDPVTVHHLRFFGGLALGKDAVWVGDEAGGLYRSSGDEPFTPLQPDLAVSCLHHDSAGALWICTPALADQSAVLVSDDQGQTLRPHLALQQVQAVVECPGSTDDRCGNAWNEWQADVLDRGLDPYGPVRDLANVPPTAALDDVPIETRETSAAAPELGHSTRAECSFSAGRAYPLPTAGGLLLLSLLLGRRRGGARPRLRHRASGTTERS